MSKAQRSPQRALCHSVSGDPCKIARITPQYLIFDASDDGADIGSWEAMASVRAADLPAVLAEVQQVLVAVERHSPGPRGALDEGGSLIGICF